MMIKWRWNPHHLQNLHYLMLNQFHLSSMTALEMFLEDITIEDLIDINVIAGDREEDIRIITIDPGPDAGTKLAIVLMLDPVNSPWDCLNPRILDVIITRETNIQTTKVMKVLITANTDPVVKEGVLDK